jgi:predicted TIM-barrel fold metal-dependent hydrolase
MVIDIHTHAFPDSLAERAIPLLEEEADISACLDGKISSLVASMDRAGVDVAVVSSIATKPEQFSSILEWSSAIAGERIIPFPSVHPADPRVLSRIGEIKAAGFRGIKLHPYYQEFFIDAPDVLPIYERIEREELVLLMHTGFDIAFERKRIADPARLESIMRTFPGLEIIASHYGAWEDWDEVESRLLGKSVYIDTSYSVPFLGADRARDFLLRHPGEFILFGSDSPWGDQQQDLKTIREMDLGDERTEALLGRNAARLLGMV